MSIAPSNTDDTIDSRDVIARLEELRDEREDLTDAAINGDPEDLDDARKSLDEWDGENGDELAALEELNAEGENYAADWTHGEQLIRDTYFETYAQELAEDIGAIDPKAVWPLSHIDWRSAARELQMDYTEVDFDGVTYWVL